MTVFLSTHDPLGRRPFLPRAMLFGSTHVSRSNSASGDVIFISFFIVILVVHAGRKFR